MIKVLLVYPPMVFGKRRGFGFPPLGILYIASFLQKKGIGVKVIDSFIVGHTLKELVEAILKDKPDIVGFSTMTCQVKAVLDIAEKLKSRAPSLKIIVGGAHVSSTKDELFNYTKDIDFLFYGEAEKSFYKLVYALEKNLPFEEIDGLIYKKNGKVVINNCPLSTLSLDELPFPDLGLLNIQKYDSYYAKELPLTSLIASRGCPFNCTFCDAYATHGKVLRFRTPKNIVDEIEYNHKKYRIRQFMIKDSTFTVNKKWVYEICSEIIKRGLKINWSCNTRVDLVDEDILQAMKKGGCYMVMFGIESGTQKILDILRKGITIEQTKRGISICKKAGIGTTGYFMIGNPGETEDDAHETIKFSKKLGLDLVTFGVTVAYPGTEFYNWALKNKALPDKFWYMRSDAEASNSIREVSGNLNLDNFSPHQQTKIVKQANKGFYLRPSFILKRILKMRKFHDIKRALKSLKEL